MNIRDLSICALVMLTGMTAAFFVPTARADMCALDKRAGATLLFPYFEVDLNQPLGQGVSTRIWIRNTATRPELVNVVMWSDYGIPAYSFNVYLPAFGTQRIDLGDLLINGKQPSTGPGVSPIGAFDSIGTQINFPNCNTGSNPNNGSPVYATLSLGDRNEIKARLSGVATPITGQCFGFNYGDNVARGYVTVDTINSCTGAGFSPADAGYVQTVVTNDNVLVGGFELVDWSNNFADGGDAVALEASNILFPGDLSFYGRYVVYTAEDQREPLPFSWAFDYNNDATSADIDSAELLIWRALPPTSPMNCAIFPSWFPLADTERRPFDSGGHTPSDPVFPPPQTYMTLATQRFRAADINTSLSEPTPARGSARINLTPPPNGQPLPDGQSWVAVLHSSQGRFSEITPASSLDSGCTSGLVVPANTGGILTQNPKPPSYVFRDGFSS